MPQSTLLSFEARGQLNVRYRGVLWKRKAERTLRRAPSPSPTLGRIDGREIVFAGLAPRCQSLPVRQTGSIIHSGSSRCSCASLAKLRPVSRNSALIVIPIGEEIGKQTRSGYPVDAVFETPQRAYGTRGRSSRSELGALPFPLVEPRLNRVDHHRGERDLLVEGVLPDALMQIDRQVNRRLAEALPVLGAQPDPGWRLAKQRRRSPPSISQEKRSNHMTGHQPG